MEKLKDKTTEKKLIARNHKEMRAGEARGVNRAALKRSRDRFDAKLPAEQKEFFEKAADIGQYRSLSDFVLKAAQEKAEEIIAQHESFLTSERDKEVFFHALMRPPQPNSRLQNSMKDYLDLIGRA